MTDPADWGDPRTKTIRWYDPAVQLGAAERMTGLEFTRAIRDGLIPPPPFIGILGVRLVEVEEGLIRLESTPDETLINAAGTVHGGVLCTLMDTAMGMAVRSTLGVGLKSTTIELKVSFLRPLPFDGSTASVVGRVLKSGRRVTFAECHAYSGDAVLVGHGTSTLTTIGAPGGA